MSLETMGLEANNDAVEDQEVDQNQDLQPEQATEEQQVSPDVERAMKNGWRPKEEWNGDPDDWVSAKKFNERGEMIGSIRDLKSRVEQQDREFQERLDRANKLHEIQQKALISDLEAKRTEAIQDADVDRANKIQGEIDDLRSEPEKPNPQVNSDQAILDQWNQANPWIMDGSPKAAYAGARFGHYAQTMGHSEAIKAMEADVAQHFPDVNPRRDKPAAAEGGQSRPGQRQSRKLQWNDLSAEEIKYYNAVPGAWKSKDEFLQAVQDTRKGV